VACGQESFGELVVAGGEAAKLFELVEEALDPIAAAIEFLVKGRFAAARGERRDDVGDTVAGQAGANAIGIVATIEEGRLQHVVSWKAFVEAFKLLTVVRLAGREAQGDGAVFIQSGGVDFGA
jgi:hypothetical protein